MALERQTSSPASRLQVKSSALKTSIAFHMLIVFYENFRKHAVSDDERRLSEDYGGGLGLENDAYICRRTAGTNLRNANKTLHTARRSLFTKVQTSLTTTTRGQHSLRKLL